MATHPELSVEEQQFLQSVSPDVLAQIEELKVSDPEAAEQLMTQLYQDYTGQTDIAAGGLERGAGLEDTPGAEGRQVGNMYVAANPMEHIATALRQNKGRRQYNTSMDRLEGLSADRTAGVKGMAGMMMDAGREKVDLANAQMVAEQQMKAQALAAQKLQAEQLRAARGGPSRPLPGT